MPALLSFDCEFTHPVSTIGGLMQLGCIIVPWDPVTMRIVKHEVPGLKYKAEFPITQGPEHQVTDWVRENQKDLLDRCEALESGVYKTSRDGLIKLLKRATDLYGAPIIPAGWCLGSDMAYLHRTLHDDHELVHYSAIDLKGLIMALMGEYDPGDKEAAEFLGVADKNENEHDALADAEHQLKLILAAFKKINEGGAHEAAAKTFVSSARRSKQDDALLDELWVWYNLASKATLKVDDEELTPQTDELLGYFVKGLEANDARRAAFSAHDLFSQLDSMGIEVSPPPQLKRRK